MRFVSFFTSYTKDVCVLWQGIKRLRAAIRDELTKKDGAARGINNTICSAYSQTGHKAPLHITVCSAVPTCISQCLSLHRPSLFFSRRPIPFILFIPLFFSGSAHLPWSQSIFLLPSLTLSFSPPSFQLPVTSAAAFPVYLWETFEEEDAVSVSTIWWERLDLEMHLDKLGILPKPDPNRHLTRHKHTHTRTHLVPGDEKWFQSVFCVN